MCVPLEWGASLNSFTLTKSCAIPKMTRCARFEIPTEDLLHDPPSADHRIGVTTNPAYKGRSSPGTMPHRSARFELHVPEDEQAEIAHVPNAGHIGDARNDQQFRFGGRRVEPGRMAHQGSRFHNNDWEDVTPQHGRQGHVPAGGQSTFTFG